MDVEDRARSAVEKTSWNVESGEALIDGFIVNSRLGGGRDYEAYLAFDPLRYCLVVVKMLRPSAIGRSRAHTAIRREAAALTRVDHPVTIRLLDARIDGDRPYLVLEYVEGPRLSTLLRRHGKLSVEQVMPLGLQLASALHYLRAIDMTHLDIKPKNIIMAGPPRLIDFSIATQVARTSEYEGPVGTRTYMAPEQCDPKAEPAIGPAADVWGLGTVLYESLAGEPAFPLDGPHRHPQLHQPAPWLRDVPPVIASTIAACLATDPARRPTPAAVSEALGEVVAVLPRRMILSRLRPGARR